WSSDVCSSDLEARRRALAGRAHSRPALRGARPPPRLGIRGGTDRGGGRTGTCNPLRVGAGATYGSGGAIPRDLRLALVCPGAAQQRGGDRPAPVSDEPEPVRGGVRPFEGGFEGNHPRDSGPRVHTAGAGSV